MDQGRPKKFTIPDEDHDLEFEGFLLGEASSFKKWKTRWYEVAVYRTVGNTYVVAGAGRSVVEGEVDRCWAYVSDSPRGIIERLYMQDDDGVWYLPRTSREVLQIAAHADEEFRQEYAVETID